ncbi:MAG: hypothetical protein AB1690_02550 [Candidatus Zixiibacteriota bacterium]
MELIRNKGSFTTTTSMRIAGLDISRCRYIAIDFDGTLVTNKYPDIGEPIPKNIEILKRHHLAGDKIIIWTCRQGKELSRAVEWLEEQSIPFDWVNENPEFETGSRKIYADIYYDDRNGFIFPENIGLGEGA